MDDSQRRRPSNSSARRLFTERSPTRSQNGQARRKLVLVSEDHQTSDGMIDPRREPNVVARLMGLESLPESEHHLIIKPIHKQQQQPVVQLHELLKIKEPLLLKELLRESDEQTQAQPSSRKPSLMEKFTGLVKRRPEERARKHSSSPVRSPIKSPIRSKRGLMLEAAVKFLDVDSPQLEPQKSHTKHQEEVQLRKKKKDKKLSLSRSSSEPCLSSSASSSSSSSHGKVGIRGDLRGKLSELGKKLSSSSKVQSKGGSGSGGGGGNLVRSKSDLSLEKPTRKHQVGGLGLGLLHHHSQSGKRELLDHSSKQSLSSSESSTESKPNNNNNNSTGIGLLRLFGNHHRSKDQRVASDGQSESTSSTPNTTKRSSEPSALVRTLLLRRKNTPTKPPPRQRCQVSSPASASIQSSSDDLTSSEQFSDEFSDEGTRSEASGSGSPSSSSSSRLEKSGQPSPVSVLEAAFVDDQTPTETSSCTSVEDSPESSSGPPPADEPLVSTSGPSSTGDDDSKNIINAMILDISRIRCLDLSAIGFSEYRSPCRERFIEEVLSTSESLWEENTASTSRGCSWYDDGLPISHETFTVMEHKLVSGAVSGSFQARKLMFHCVDEAVNSRFRWRSRSSKIQPVKKHEIISQVEDQIDEWSSMRPLSTDQLVERDMSVGAGKWRDWDQQVEEIARDLECSILRRMIEEAVGEMK